LKPCCERFKHIVLIELYRNSENCQKRGLIHRKSISNLPLREREVEGKKEREKRRRKIEKIEEEKGGSAHKLLVDPRTRVI
jgi:hypothetical protein